MEEFNKRETVFKVENTFYPELDDLIKEFQPFQELIACAKDSISSIKEWTTEKLAGQNYALIQS